MPKTSSNVSDGAQILLVDDQPTNLDVLCRLLELEGYDVLLAPTGQVALNSATRVIPDLILLDVTMPEMDGYEVCRRLKENPKTEKIPVIFITGRDLKEDIVAGFEAGGVDYITKPIQEEEVLVRVRTHVRMNKMAGELAAKNKELEEKNKALEEGIAQRRVLKGQLTMISDREIERWGLEGFIGKSPTVQRIMKEIRLMQENIATTVLITGESGTGKELIARAIHFGSARKDGPFVPVNCAAVPSELVESLLFGHTRGAFTGAAADKTGFGGIHLTGVTICSVHGVSSRWQALPGLGWRVSSLVSNRCGLPGLPRMAAVARRLRLSELRPRRRLALGRWPLHVSGVFDTQFGDGRYDLRSDADTLDDMVHRLLAVRHR